MSFVNEKKVNKTRKEHKCWGCLQNIPTGSAAVYVSGVSEGDFFSNYYCTPCESFIKAHFDYFEEGVVPGGVTEVKKEMEK